MTGAAPPGFVPRRGRPSAEQAAAIERTILATARRLFLQDGYETTAMEGIAAEAGVSKGTLYARHPSKEVLFDAVVRECVAEWADDSARGDDLPTTDLADRLHHHARTIARSQFIPEVRAFQRLLSANRDRFPVLSEAMYENGYLFIVRLLAAEIEAAAERDGIPVKDADGIGRQLVSTITGYHQQESAARAPALADVEGFAIRAVDLLIVARAAW